jgi:formylglycine-generating enzyme required for sulfatase activity
VARLLRGIGWGWVLVWLCSCSKPEDSRGGGSSSGNPAAGGKAGAAAVQSGDFLTKSGVEMVYLPGGEFTMGSDKESPDEAPAHRVRVGGFLMDKFEVTHEMFVKAQLPNPSHWQDNPKKPVERVRWRDAKQYCNERSLLEGLEPCYDEKSPTWECHYEASGYRLPTEAEWEYACRAGTDREYDFGPADKLKQYAWFEDNAGARTHPVGQKKPNAWGLYDLYGNVSEWCEDVYSPDYYRQSPVDNPRGPAEAGLDPKRVMRGGSWKASANMCRATFRQGQRTGDTDACFYTDYCGFRCVRALTPEQWRAWQKKK